MLTDQTKRRMALESRIRAAGIPVHGTGGWPDPRIDFNEASPAQQQQAKQIVAAFNALTELEQLQIFIDQEKRQKREHAIAILTASDPWAIGFRAALRSFYQDFAEVRAKLGLPVRTWQQMLETIRQDIGDGNAD